MNIVRMLGIVEYESILCKMKDFTETRNSDTTDEFWVLEHKPVFTLGLAGKQEHLLNTNHNIPTIQCDRGGQVTYHGIGQLVVYLLIDLKRNNLSIRDLVIRIENSVIYYLNSLNIKANSNRLAPGVYINDKKIASLGLKVRNGYTYHGLSFNINMDLTPFNYINVCGYKGLQVTQLRDELLLNNLSNSNKKEILDIEVQNVAPDLMKFLLKEIYA